MSTPIRKPEGQFNGSIGDGAKNVPAPAPSAAVHGPATEAQGARPAFTSGYFEASHRMLLDGDSYTGVAIYFRCPESGVERVEWAGELHGVWGGGGSADPALELLCSLSAASDGALPHRAVFTRPSVSMPGGTDVRNLVLCGGGLAEVRARSFR